METGSNGFLGIALLVFANLLTLFLKRVDHSKQVRRRADSFFVRALGRQLSVAFGPDTLSIRSPQQGRQSK